jgi:hypothetical protein
MTTSVPESDPAAALGFKWEAAADEIKRREEAYEREVEACEREVKSAYMAEHALWNEIARVTATTAAGALVQAKLLGALRTYDLDDENDPLYLLVDITIKSLVAGLESMAGLGIPASVVDPKEEMRRALATIKRLAPGEEMDHLISLIWLTAGEQVLMALTRHNATG